ncbi:hypothetical protein [Christensenella intestinihominis]|uniref:hypothetical protein n=1 Tax=Christensenella intestinihominis TaxID=1851429 RepID=UPI0008321660|nr:hypothetical protein [Christensenella intestinihominis]
MTKQLVTPLAYLMDMLYIQGTQLAKAVHVDRTIISRWKNGRTELNMKSQYFSDIVDAILDINEQQGIKTLERFFSSIDDVEINSRDELYEYVARWLVSKDFEKKFKEPDNGNSLYNASYKIYKGPSGKREAILYLLKVADSLPGGETIWGYDADSHIFYSGSHHSSTSQKLFLDAQKKGHKLKTMFYMNRPAEQIYNMSAYWLPMLLSPQMEAYYTYDTEVPFYCYIYAIKGKLALVGTNHNDNTADMYTAVYDDPMTVAQFDFYLENHLKSFKPLMKQLSHKDLCDDFKENEIAEFLKKDMNQYVNVASSPFITISKETIENVIFELELTPAEERKVMRFYRTCNANSKKFLSENHFSRIIFSMEYIHSLLPSHKVETPVFSSLLGRKAEISSKYIAREIKIFMDEIKNNPTVEVALLPYGTTAFLPEVNLWVKENAIAYFSQAADTAVRVLTDEFLSVNTFYSMIDKYWEQLPIQSKEKEWVYDQITRAVTGK